MFTVRINSSHSPGGIESGARKITANYDWHCLRRSSRRVAPRLLLSERTFTAMGYSKKQPISGYSAYNDRRPRAICEQIIPTCPRVL